MHNEAPELMNAIREHLSPHAVALIVAKLQPVYTRCPTDISANAEAETRWLANQLKQMLGERELQELWDDLCV